MIVLGMIAVMGHAGHRGMTAVSHRQRSRNRADAGTQNDRRTAVGANGAQSGSSPHYYFFVANRDAWAFHRIPTLQ